jgi:predicted ATPase
MLLGRETEVGRLVELLDDARRGLSSALIVRGEAGIGKTTLLERAVSEADGFLLLRVQPLEAETELPFVDLADLLRPILHLLDRLPDPQQGALSGALALARRFLETALPLPPPR